MRLFVFARHGESAANVARVVSSDPAHGAGLTARRYADGPLPYFFDDHAVRRATHCLDALVPPSLAAPVAGMSCSRDG